MAHTGLRHAPAVAFLILFGLMAGCQQERPTSMVDPLPTPNFSGPALPSPMAVTPPHAAPSPIAPPVVSTPTPTPGLPREWMPMAAPNKWTWIVIHHSATSVGGAARFNREHQAKGWDELGYHFVIGNGTDTGNGQVEVGPRWTKQKWGAHAKTPDNRFNEHGIGICLVGNFDQTKPSDSQMKSVAKLVACMMKTYHIPADHVIGHGDTKATDCPGRNLHVTTVRRLSNQFLADAGDFITPTRTASARLGPDLLVDRAAR